MKIDQLVAATNIADLLDKEEVIRIGQAALEGYTMDKASRAEWEQRMANANKLALQVREDKNFPWVGASNVKFPLVTVAAMQYAARAYPSLISGNELVKAKVWGDDTDATDRIASRIEEHMSWQNLEQMPEWEENSDKLLLIQGITGCPHRKRTFDPVSGRQRDKLVLPDNFVINYYCTDLLGAPRYTEWYYLWPNDIYQREMDGRFSKDVEVSPAEPLDGTDELTLAKDERQGIRPPGDSDGDAVAASMPFLTGEQSCWLDLDDDGYAEPYIVTFNIDSGKVHRIVARYLPSGVKDRRGQSLGSEEWKKGDQRVYAIEPVEIYTKFPFIPSPDGGYYDLGLGTLLGPINESVNTAFNQSFDAATMATLGGGFLGRGFKSKGGPFTFQPQEWKPVDAPGDDLRKNVLPLPVRNPPTILFQLIGFLVNYAERIVSANDMQVGENVGQNTPAETARTMNENGQRVYSAIYKRTWRSLRNEFKIQASLNALFLDQEADYPQIRKMATVEDYRAMGVFVKPAADPRVTSDVTRVQQAQLIVQNAMTLPGHNKYQCVLRLYKAMNVPDIAKILPPPTQQGPDGKPQPAPDWPAPPNPKMLEVQIKQGELQLKTQQFQSDQMEMKIQLQMDIQESLANVEKMKAQAVKLLADAKGAEVEPIIKMIYAQIEAEGKRQDRIMKMIDLAASHMEKANGANDGGRMERVGAAAPNGGVPQAAAPVGPGNPGGMVQ